MTRHIEYVAYDVEWEEKNAGDKDFVEDSGVAVGIRFVVPVVYGKDAHGSIELCNRSSDAFYFRVRYLYHYKEVMEPGLDPCPDGSGLLSYHFLCVFYHLHSGRMEP